MNKRTRPSTPPFFQRLRKRMGLGERVPKCQWERPELETQVDETLRKILLELEQQWQTLERNRAREALFTSIFRRHSGRMLLDSLSPFRLTRRLETLFVSLLERARDPWPVEESLAVLDGLVARMVAKRLTLVVVGLFTVVPAVGSLVLLAQQNRHMIEQSRVEAAYQLGAIRKSMLEVINGTAPQWVNEGGTPTRVALPTYHKRIREEAFGTFVSVDKQRWSRGERAALPPTRWVDLRGSNLAGLVLGSAIGLVEDQDEDDLSRLYLADANLRQTRFLRSSLTGSVFRNAQADGLQISSADATYCDFSHMHAPGAGFLWESHRSEPLDLSHASFDGAMLQGAWFDQAMVSQASFHGTALSGVTFHAGFMVDVDLSTADLGEGIHFSESMVHRTRVHTDQRAKITLPSFCEYEATDDPDLWLIQTDPVAYESWWEQQQAAMEAAVEQERQEFESR
ncbi:MAG: pentapeptide repeat-containing protein [Puniceicoccaceae bacterium]